MSEKKGSISIKGEKKAKSGVFFNSTGLSGVACYIFCSIVLCVCYQYIGFRCSH